MSSNNDSPEEESAPLNLQSPAPPQDDLPVGINFPAAHLC